MHSQLNFHDHQSVYFLSDQNHNISFPLFYSILIVQLMTPLSAWSNGSSVKQTLALVKILSTENLLAFPNPHGAPSFSRFPSFVCFMDHLSSILWHWWWFCQLRIENWECSNGASVKHTLALRMILSIENWELRMQ